MGARSASGHYRSLPPVTVSVRPFFLEPMKLAPFLTGSNTPREEVIATSCFDSLVCGKAKTEEGVLYRWRSRVTTGTHGNLDAPLLPLYFVYRVAKSCGNGFQFPPPSSSAASPVCVAVSGRFTEDIEVHETAGVVGCLSIMACRGGVGNTERLALSPAHMGKKVAVWSIRLWHFPSTYRLSSMII